jgi:hypothetical protein
MDGRKRRGRKLLVASLGVAAVSYVGCGDNDSTVANLVAPPGVGGTMMQGKDASNDMGSLLDVVANLVAPPGDSAVDARGPRDGSFRDVVANLVAPDLGTE